MQYSFSGRENLEKQPDQLLGVRRGPSRALREISFRARFLFRPGREDQIGDGQPTNTRKSYGFIAYCSRIGAQNSTER